MEKNSEKEYDTEYDELKKDLIDIKNIALDTREILLKQGYYNYQYITTDKEKNLSTDLIEGNYFETNNEYTIYVYYKSPWERYERLVGIEKITSNSLN